MNSSSRNLFIVTKGSLILGRADFHRNLVEYCDIPDSQVVGGGVFEQKEGFEIILFGESSEYGKFIEEDVRKHIENNRVYWFSSHIDKFSFEIDLDRVETFADRF